VDSRPGAVDLMTRVAQPRLEYCSLLGPASLTLTQGTTSHRSPRRRVSGPWHRPRSWISR